MNKKMQSDPLSPSPSYRTTFFYVAINLLVFIGVASYPGFQSVHHHWIFPILAFIFLLEWTVSGGIFKFPNISKFLDLRIGRASILFIMAFLLLMGIARHETVLMCFDRCGFKLGLASFLGGILFFSQGRLRENHFWNVLRCQMAGLGSLIWAGYLILHSLNLTNWVLEIVLLVALMLFWLGRKNKSRMAAALSIPLFILIRHTGSEILIILLSYGLLIFIVWRAGYWGEPYFSQINQRENQAVPPSILKRVSLSILRISILLFFILGGIYILMGPIKKQIDPAERRKFLLQQSASQPSFPKPETLSPLARNLYSHVDMLSRKIGERAIYQIKARKQAQDYVFDSFKNLGFKPNLIKIPISARGLVEEKNPINNVDIVLGGEVGFSDEIWVVGAHYDSAPGTPGADDNASGVAVLLELARLLKDKPLKRELRLVAFSTEEPPSFGTRDMGSYQYAHGLKQQKKKLKAMISLEMVGYFNEKKGSQVYPPFLHLFYPNRGNFVSLVSNFKSRKVLREAKKIWKSNSTFPLETVILPGQLSTIALSDQLNFWDMGFPALMLSDTSFYRNPHYHQDTDTVNTLDYEKMAEITKALAVILTY